LRQQLLVGARLRDPAGVHDVDDVRRLQRRNPVGDHDQGLAPAQAPQAVQDRRLGGGVHAGERVVEDEHRPVAPQRPGDGQPLLLAARQGDAALAHHLIVSVGKGLDVLVEAGLDGRGPDARRVGGAGAQGDILGDGAGEEERLLRDHRDPLVDAVGIQLGEVGAVEADHARFRPEQAAEDPQQRGLAAAHHAGDAHRPAGSDVQVDTAERVLARAGVAVAQPAHAEGRFRGGGRRPARGRLHRVRQNVVQALQGRQPLLDQRHDPAQRQHRERQEAHHDGELEQFAQGQLAADHLRAAHRQNHQFHQPEHEDEERPDEAAQRGHPHLVPDILAVERLEPRVLGVLHRVQLDRLDAGDDLPDPVVDGRQRLLDPPVHGAQARQHHDDHQDEHAEHPRDHEHEGARQGKQHRHEEQEAGQGVRHVHDPRPQQGADLAQVVGAAAHQVAGLIGLVEGEVQGQQPAVEPLTQLVLDLARDADDQVPHEEHGPAGEHHDHAGPQQVFQDHAGAVGGGDLVEDPLEKFGHPHVAVVLQQHAGEAGEQLQAVLPEVGAENLEVSDGRSPVTRPAREPAAALKAR